MAPILRIDVHNDGQDHVQHDHDLQKHRRKASQPPTPPVPISVPME